jgi:NADH-quinone oxidoreductase chain G
MPDPVNVTIDDKQVAVPAGTLVVDAAKTAGVDIPIFCSHPKLDPLGACRMCLVEFVGPRGSRLDTSCTVRVSEGMVVRTDTEQVKAVREANLAFILLNHPLDCPICDKGGECPLQDQTMEYGPGFSKFIEPKRRKQKHYPISDLIMLDQERCILCWRCIRYLEEWEDKPQLGLFERGGETLIDVFPGQPGAEGPLWVDAKTSGSIIDICPVGALTNRVSRFRYRPWEMHRTPSVCTLCPVGCSLQLDERAHELRRIVARENVAVNDEWICDKGRFLHQYVDHPERLMQPLVREDGALRPATWDEALHRVVEGLETAIAAGGQQAVGGVASARVSNEGAYLFQKLFRVLLGANNVDFPDGSSVRALPTGLSAIAAIGKSDVIVLVGYDPSEATPIIDLRIKRALLRSGATLIVVNPRRIELAGYVDHPRVRKGAYLAVRPGNEAIALQTLADAIRRRRDQAAASDAKKSRAPAIADESGAAPEALRAAVALLESAASPLIIYGPEAARGARGCATAAAVGNLALALNHPEATAFVGAESNAQGARDMGLLPDALPGQQPVTDPAARERLGKVWGTEPPTEPGYSYDEMLAGRVQALYVMGANPAVEPAVAGALRELDLLIVQDLFLTETAQLADVVLPSVSFAEADGTYTNLERRVQRAPAGIRSAGQSRADWAILTALADHWLATEAAQNVPEAVSAAETPDWKNQSARRRRKSSGGPARRPRNYCDARQVLEEIGKTVPAMRICVGTPWRVRAQWPVSASQRPPRREEVIEVTPTPAPPDGTFWLVSGPLLWDSSTLMEHAAEQVRNLIPTPFVALSPADFRAAGLVEGSEVTVSSELGSVRLIASADESVQPGTAWMPAGLTGAPAETLGARATRCCDDTRLRHKIPHEERRTEEPED